MENFDKCQKINEALIQLQPDCWRHVLSRATLEAAQHQFSLAMTTIQRANDMNPCCERVCFANIILRECGCVCLLEIKCEMSRIMLEFQNWEKQNELRTGQVTELRELTVAKFVIFFLWNEFCIQVGVLA